MIQSSPVTRRAPYSHRRRALLHRGVPLLVAAAVALVAGVVAGARHRPAEQRTAERYVAAWARADWAAMYRLLGERSRSRTSAEAFRRAHEQAAETATATRLVARSARGPQEGTVRIPVRVHTRLFGAVRATLELPFEDGDGGPRVAWSEHLAFPGLRRGERLERTTRLPTRATLLAADGTVIARGDERATDDPELQGSIGGQLGPIPPDRAAELRAKGVPPDARVGISGLERALDDELRGRPGGELRAGTRILAATAPRPAGAVRSTIVRRVQRAAVAALAGRFGGAVALSVRTGAVHGAAGIALSGVQPPGSTFKIVTLAGALRAGLTSTRRRYPVETHTTIEGVRLENANGEACGGTLITSFAESCNSVFAPLGARLGARRLVEAAEAFGFNRPPGIDGAATSTIPAPGEIGDDLAVGASAIGQGRVQATALQMALVAATVARRGVRPVPTLVAGTPPRGVRTWPARTMRAVGRAMRAVVEEGTGGAAAIPGTRVAGKTGTAELRATVPPAPPAGGTAVAPAPAEDPTDTDAWFTAYAPVTRARVAVAVLLVQAGSGGATAAPAAKALLRAGLERSPAAP